MTDERFEQFLRSEAPSYNDPPATPRAEMWNRIHARRGGASAVVPLHRRSRWRWGLAAAALVVLGFAIGRVTVVTDGPTALNLASERAADSVVFSFAAADHLRQTDAFLSAFRLDARLGQPGAEAEEWARDLLATTRMMMDSPAADDTELRELFEDLELILIEILNYGERRSALELELIEDGLDEGAVLLRLRARLSRDHEAFPAMGVS